MAPAVREALRAFASADVRTDEGQRWRGWLAGRAAGFIWDYEVWDALTMRQVRAARDAGALAELPFALSTRVGVCLFGGEVEAAASLVDEASVLAEATDGRIIPPYGELTVAAFRGREDEPTAAVASRTEGFRRDGEGMGLTLSLWATAVLCNGLARYDDAFAAAEDACEDPHELWFSTFALVELIEAAGRSGRGDRAAEALEILSTSTSASGTPWALGVEARSRAILADGDAAEQLYREAIERLEPTRLRVDLARARLLYGEWLRRERRRVDAREQLRIAHDFFSDVGMEAFAERASIELRATGEHPARERSLGAFDQLTPQEAQVSRLVAQGHTNREIAAQLFISPSTVEYHLGKVFRKLDVKSRTQLAHRLSS
jgi:DNA-binding CsgD family transcriptional regulator